MNQVRLHVIFGVASVLLLSQLPVMHGQVVNGTIFGTVRDSTGGVIAQVTVSAKSVETGAVRTAITDSTGAYQILSVPAGNYDVEAAVSGFRTSVRKGITVTVGATVAANFELAVGEVQQKVEVQDTPPQVDMNNAAMGGVVGENAVRELPLNGRDWLQLVTLTAGVTGGIGQQSSAGFSNSRAARGNGQSLSISGGRPTGNVFMVDGLVVNDYANASPGSGLNVNLGVEAIREFRVLTNEYNAEYGRSTGGVVTAVYKSGSNQFHGGVFEFLRNSALDARNTFDFTGKPPFRRNQFGGSAGGPIIRNKTFIFGDYEELREVRGLAHNSFTLSPNARNGLLCIAKGSDPCASTTQVNIDPRIKPYLAAFPIANGQIVGNSAAFNFAGTQRGFEHYGVTRVDHNFSANTILSGSYQIDDTTEGQPDPYNQKITGSPSRHQNAVLTLQHIFTPALLNTARFGISRTHATDALDQSAINPVATDTSLGFVPGRPAGILTISEGNITGTQGGLGASGSDILNYTSFQGGDDLSWVKGRHTFGFGGTVQRMRYNKNSQSIPLGEFDFDTVANFLQGIPAQFTGDEPDSRNIRGIRQTYLGLYAQDAIALRPNFKLTLGVRYEYVNPPTDHHNRTATLPFLASPTPVLGGPYFNTTSKNFAPRVAIAWDPTGKGKMSIRSGFGFYDLLPFPYLMENRTNGFPVFLQGILTPVPSAVFPTGAFALVGVTPSSRREVFVQQNPPRAYSMQWNFSIQRQLTPDLALTAGYVGSRGNHLPRSIEDIDQVPLSLTSVAPDGHILFPIPPKGTKPQRINPNFGRIAATLWDDWSTYHALVTDLDKRFSHGLFFKAAYTWSKSIDQGSNTFSDNESTNTSGSAYAFIPRLQKGVSDFNVTHNFVMNSSWTIPSGSMSGVSKAVLGGWELGGIFSARSGAPFTVTLSSDQAFTGDSRVKSTSGGQRPDFNAAPGCSPNAINPGNPSNYINLSCFSFPAPGTLGNLGRNTLRGPGLQEFDFSLLKNWLMFHERVRLQFRAEAFNFLNKANYQAPKTKIFDGSGKPVLNAPQLTSPTQTSERQIQFGLKLNW